MVPFTTMPGLIYMNDNNIWWGGYFGDTTTLKLTVDARISWGQHPIRKLLHTFPSENLSVFLFSPERDKYRIRSGAGMRAEHQM